MKVKVRSDLRIPGDDSQVFTVKSFYTGLPRWPR